MSLKISPVSFNPTIEEKRKWRDFVAASPHGDVLQCLEWGPVKKPESQPLAVALRNGDGFDATALVLKRALPPRKATMGRSLFYLPRGPILDWSKPDVFENMIEELKAEARKHKAISLKIDPCVLQNTPGFKERLAKVGFVTSPEVHPIFGGTQPRCNMKMDISAPLDNVLSDTISQKWRYNIRLSAKKGIRVEDNLGRDGLKIFHDIYKVTFERNHFKGYSLAYFEKMWDALAPSGLIKLFVSFHEGQALSAAICFLLPPQCWYMFGASSNEGRNLMPNHAMQWAMIQWAKENGCTTYDFRGVPDPELGEIPPHEEGLVRFKSGFGAEMVCYEGEFDLPLSKSWYWLWTQGRPKLMAAVKKLKR
ncbi:UDP-N-acetylmuramoylpentapeptide-lysine N(6)-alanyltransferase [Abditibacteriota bacterium]|nr:UDP-N-acetylmuramoylpentapeptide-lysine N(6)-alanyltransferase [Abditibacteriota bacterium]